MIGRLKRVYSVQKVNGECRRGVAGNGYKEGGEKIGKRSKGRDKVRTREFVC